MPDSALSHPVDRLLFAEAPDAATRVLVVDATPELLAAARTRWGDVTAWNDLAAAAEPQLPERAQRIQSQLPERAQRIQSQLPERAQRVQSQLPERAQRVEGTLPADLLTGVDLVLAHLPKASTALDEYAQRIREHAAPGVRLVAAGRQAHMTRAQNDVLGRSFAEVSASRGVDKCRALRASRPVSHAPAPTSCWPRRQVEPATGLTLVAHGATFAGARLDAGTKLLLSTADRWPGGDALDFGCGNGVLTAVLARRGNRVTGLDISRAAVASTIATLGANDLRAEVILAADSLGGIADASLDLVVTNPPFHDGVAKDSTTSIEMIRDAVRVLRPGGELWCVFNGHLPYLQTAGAAFGTARLVAKDRSYQVLRTVR